MVVVVVVVAAAAAAAAAVVVVVVVVVVVHLIIFKHADSVFNASLKFSILTSTWTFQMAWCETADHLTTNWSCPAVTNTGSVGLVAIAHNSSLWP